MNTIMKSKYRKLDELYKEIPSIECKGLCHPSCTVIPVAKIENRRARDRLGKSPYNSLFDTLEEAKVNGLIPPCRALKNGKCSIYDIRPAICRLYGVSEGLPCMFGCKPKETISKKDAYSLIREIEEL